MATSNLRFRIIGDDDASPAFLQVAASAKLLNATFSDLGQNALGLTKLVGGAGLVPVLAGAAAATVELTTSLASGAGALGIFGLSVAGIGADMVKAQTKITALDTKLGTLDKGTQDYRDTLKELHDQQDAFNKQFGPAAKGLDDMKSAFDKFKQSTSGVTTDVMGKAFELLASVLPKLAPVANAAGRAVGGLIDELQGWVDGPGFKAVLDWFQKSGPKAITHFGHIVGNTIDGLGGILSNFVGPGDHAAKTLDRLTKRFADWGHSKGVSKSVDGFLKYVKDNGPNITSSLQSLADTLPKLATSAGQLGGLNLSVITAFLNLIAGMPQGAFNVVVDGMFGIVAAAKALAIIQGLTALMTGLSTAITVLGDACIATRLGLILIAIADGAVAIAAGLAAGATAALDAALAVLTSPITLVIAGLIALAAGFVYAYKHSETFRSIVQGALHGIADAGKWMGGQLKDVFNTIVTAMHGVGKVAAWLWNNAFAPTIKYILHGLGMLLDVWAKMLGALSHVPGFGWAKDAAAAMQNAADKANAVANAIHNIPTSKTITLFIKTIQKGTPSAFTHSGGGSGGGSGSGSSGSGFSKDAGAKAGRDWMDGLLQGIAGRQVSVQNAVDRVAGVIQKVGDKLSNLMSMRAGFLATFKADSIFGTDMSAGGGIAALIASQQAQATQASQLLSDVKSVTKMGLSKALIKQLQSQGTSGAAALHAIATGDPAQIKQLNALNKQTNDALRAAGLRAGNYVRGGSINSDIRLARKQEHVLERLEHHLKDLAASEKKGQTIIVEIDGEAVIKAVHRRNKRKGVKSAGM